MCFVLRFTQIVPESQVSLSGSEKTYAAPTSRVPPGICQVHVLDSKQKYINNLTAIKMFF